MRMLVQIEFFCCFFEVYDVSKFVSRHPGGMEQIMMGAGRDVTQLFESYHSFDIYKYVLRNVQLYAIMGWLLWDVFS